jgi:excinuclease UvrABC nuclease subunit
MKTELNLKIIFKEMAEYVENLNKMVEYSISDIQLPPSPGVYLIYFEGCLKYIGSSKNIAQRINTNLLSGNKDSHTLINKLIKVKKWHDYYVTTYLRRESNIKFVETKDIYSAKILEDILIAIHKPEYNKTLSELIPTESS